MHILFLNQFFWPDQAPTGRLLEDLSCELVAQGHQVTVICGGNGYGGETRRQAPPVDIIRLPNLAFSRGSLSRSLSWGSFLSLAALRALTIPNLDAIVSMTTPPGLSLAVLPARWFRRARLWVWEMDVYPDVAIALGHLRPSSLAARLIGRLIDRSRRSSQGVIALGDCMKQRLVARGIPPEKIHVHENWAEIDDPTPLDLPPGEPLTVFYCGNFGLAHDLDTLLGVLPALRGDPIRFVFAGGGALRPALEAFCQTRGLRNVTFLPYLDRQEFHAQLAACHLGLVTLRPECAGTMVTCKFYSPLAAGRPVLFIGPQNCTPAAHIRNHHCGWLHPPGDITGIVELLRRLNKNPASLKQAAENAARVQRNLFNGPKRIAALAARLTEAQTNQVAGEHLTTIGRPPSPDAASRPPVAQPRRGDTHLIAHGFSRGKEFPTPAEPWKGRHNSAAKRNNTTPLGTRAAKPHARRAEKTTQPRTP